MPAMAIKIAMRLAAPADKKARNQIEMPNRGRLENRPTNTNGATLVIKITHSKSSGIARVSKGGG